MDVNKLSKIIINTHCLPKTSHKKDVSMFYIFKDDFMNELTSYDIYRLLNVCIYSTMCSREESFEDLNEQPMLDHNPNKWIGKKEN